MKQQNSIIVALEDIVNDGFCQRTHHRAYKTLEQLAKYITNEEYEQIKTYLLNTDSDNPDVWSRSGINDAIKYEYQLFVSYMKTLIEKYQKKGFKG